MVRISRHDFGQLSSEPIAKAGDLFVFQQQDGAVKRVVVDSIAAGACEGKRIQAAETAKWTNRVSSHLRNKRAAAAIAQGIDDRLK